jgi:hypothetical protein
MLGLLPDAVLPAGGWRASTLRRSPVSRPDALAVVTFASAEVVDGAVQRQSVALLAPLPGGDLRLRAA